MIIRIDNENLFKEKLKNGINLFVGAGFSCLPDEKGNTLPIGNELAKEICDKFEVEQIYSDDLPTASALVRNKHDLQNFLRERFRVTSYNPAYMAINKINLKSFITTNIDNIIHSVIENGGKYFLNSISYYGATNRAPNALPYIPLHGDVNMPDSELYFGKFDMAVVDKKNEDLFKEMFSKLSNTPTLFWGYSFNDYGVLRTVERLLAKAPHDIWIQCLAEDTKTIAVFKSKGCNIIEGDTQSLLEWINKEAISAAPSEKSIINKGSLKRFMIPSLQSVEATLLEDFYQNGRTAWHPILSKRVPELSLINAMYDTSLANKNTILLGGSFTGKTTALMQLALKIDKQNKLYLDKITSEEALFILKNIGNEETWVFFHNFAEDIEAYKIFASHPKIITVGVADDYQFEMVKHLLVGIPYRYKEIGDITILDAQKIYDEIPLGIRTKEFSYKENEDEKFSMLEMISKNVSNVPTQERIKKILLNIKNRSPQAYEAVLLTSYLEYHRSALSTDIIVSYFGIGSYTKIQTIIKVAQNILNDYEIDFSRDDSSQDFFILRSKLFLRNAMLLLRYNPLFKKDFAKVITKFIYDVSPFNIYRFHIFRRKAYDSKLFNDLFDKTTANELYKFLYDYDSNPYTLQQWALYCAKIGNYTQAFIYIDQALDSCPSNFSMQNSRAIIFFEANKGKGSPAAFIEMQKAMALLGFCYNNDKKKDYHAHKFAEFACYLAENMSEKNYIGQAITWLEEIRIHETNHKETDALLHKLHVFK